MTDVEFGKNGACCGKPVGCSMAPEGCLYLQHPWKRRNVFGDADTQCLATSVAPHPESGDEWRWRCMVKGSHDTHEMKPWKPNTVTQT